MVFVMTERGFQDSRNLHCWLFRFLRLGNKFCLAYIFLLSAIFLFQATLTGAAEGLPNFGPLQGAVRLIEADRNAEAAVTLDMTADALIASSTETGSLRVAGFARVLAAVAHERAGNADAYDAWGAAMRNFLRGGTTWDTERAALAREIRALNVSSPPDAPIHGGPFLRLAAKIKLQEYSGPKPGLRSSDLVSPIVQTEEWSIETEGSTYEGRPLAAIPPAEQEMPPEAAGFGSISRSSQIEVAPVDDGPAVTPFQRERPENPAPPSPKSVENPDTAALPGPGLGYMLDENETLEPLEIPDADRALPIIREPAAAESLKTPPRGVGLTAADEVAARTAWRYFEINFIPNTGFFNSVHRYSKGTMWDVGSMIAGIVAAERLGLIDKHRFDIYLGKLLASLEALPLFDGVLPNREYDFRENALLDIKGSPSRIGSGWSTLDIGRTLIWLRIVADWYPQYAPVARRIVEHWRLDALSVGGQMYGRMVGGNTDVLRQEGRFGYEQYAAAGFALWNHRLPDAEDYKEVVEVSLLGERIEYDPRQPAFLNSEPFVLAGLELGGIDDRFRQAADALYRVQARRAVMVGHPVALSEDATDQKPWFLYNTVLFEGQPWQCVTHRAVRQERCQDLSTKAAFGWAALHRDEYSGRLRNAVSVLRDSQAGFYAGRWADGGVHRSLNINTNAVVLEALLFASRGNAPFRLR
jgi:hypothetical protein